MKEEIAGQKPWYKTWWGILAMLAFLPITLVYMVWNKTEWKSYIKGLATVGILIFSVAVASSSGQPKVAEEVLTPQKQIETPQVQETLEQAPVESVTVPTEANLQEANVEPDYEEDVTVTGATNTDNTCDSNYSGACVPIDTDVDCAGGSGKGPSYVAGPVTVIGADIYGLDRDGNGIGCES